MTGVIITTFLRDDLLDKSIQSIVNNWLYNFKIIIVDQNPTEEKLKKYSQTNIYYFGVPYNSGLSCSRNFGVKKAKDLGCKYIIVGSESFIFNESIQKINNIIDILEISKYSFCGFELENCNCRWEAKLDLIKNEAFELDFININYPDFKHYCNCEPFYDLTVLNNYIAIKADIIPLWQIDICRNFFIAKIDMLLDIKWDENLKLGEHEDEFWRIKQAGYKGVWTNYINSTKMIDRPTIYTEFRKQNFSEGIKKLKEKYNISGWVTYKHLERAKDKLDLS